MLFQIQEYFDANGDERVKDWPLMSSIYFTIAIILAYIYWVKVAGPKFMENRKPFEFKNVILVYNLLQVGLSLWLFYGLLTAGWENYFTLKCVPFDRSTNARAMRMAALSWWYYISKFTEFMDTVFFVLRKKQNQVSMLHLIHHSLMPFLGELFILSYVSSI